MFGSYLKVFVPFSLTYILGARRLLSESTPYLNCRYRHVFPGSTLAQLGISMRAPGDYQWPSARESEIKAARSWRDGRRGTKVLGCAIRLSLSGFTSSACKTPILYNHLDATVVLTIYPSAHEA